VQFGRGIFWKVSENVVKINPNVANISEVMAFVANDELDFTVNKLILGDIVILLYKAEYICYA
jgi:hypothetical protein